MNLNEIEAALPVVRSHVPPTPQYRWPLLERRAGTELWIKHENHGPVGAFKLRGGLVYIDTLRRTQPDVRGVIAATRGNHGQSIAFACARVGLRAVIVVPHGNSAEKNAAMRALGAELIEHGEDFQASLEYAQTLAAEQELHFLPSFHPELVRGVATYALEFFRAVPELDYAYVPIGLGSGICGMMALRDALHLRTRIVGVVSAHAPAYARSVEAGKPVSIATTTRVADGMACRQPVPEALEQICAGIDHIVEVTDDEVRAAMRAYFTDTHNVSEGAGAAGLAAVLLERERLAGLRVGAVLTGGNVDAELFSSVIAKAH